MRLSFLEAIVYITVQKSGKHSYVKLMEYQRGQDGKKHPRVVQNFGRLDALLAMDPQALEKLKAKYAEEREAKRRALHQQRMAKLQHALSRCNELEEEYGNKLPLLLIGHCFVARLWEDLKLADQLLRQLTDAGVEPEEARRLASLAGFVTGMKVMDPQSTFVNAFGGVLFLCDPMHDATSDDVVDVLKRLPAMKDKLLAALFAETPKPTHATLAVSEVVNITRYGNISGFAAVVFDENAIPRDVEFFENAEAGTLKTVVEKLKANYPIDRAVVVAEDAAPALRRRLAALGLPATPPKTADKSPEADEARLVRRCADCFRVMGRLLVVATDEKLDLTAIAGHVVSSFLALFLLRRLQGRLEADGKPHNFTELCSMLSGACVVPLPLGGGQFLYMNASHPETVCTSFTHEKTDFSKASLGTIMKACGLQPLGNSSVIDELRDSLAIPGLSDREAVRAWRG